MIATYQQADGPQAAELEVSLRALRRELAERLLAGGDAAEGFSLESESGKRFLLLRRSGLQDLRSDEADGELRERMSPMGGYSEPRRLAAFMLMFAPHEIPVASDLAEIPAGFRLEYVDYLLTPPGVFNRQGEADAYADFMMAAVGLLHRCLVRDRNLPQAGEIHQLFVRKASFIQFYFNERNLRDTYRLRAEILEAWAEGQNARLDFAFPEEGSGNPAVGYPRVKVAFLSAHFSPQTEIFLLLSYFDKLPRETFEITLYALRETGHPLETHCRSRVDHFVVLPEAWSFQQKADRIRADRQDLLLVGTNTSAVTNPVTILALFKLARTQVLVENSPVSTGFRNSDYYISSEFNEPEDDAQRSYSEKLYRVPGMLNYYAYHFDREPQTISSGRDQLRIPGDAVVFFSGANFFKILPELSEVWVRIMRRVPNSFLVLMPFNPNWTSRYLSRPFTERLQTQMREQGVEPGRLRLVQKVPTRADVHAVMALCDIYLDSFPYAGACSMIDPLTVGMPVVCRAGRTMRGNLAAAMLKGANLEWMVSDDAAAYEERAVELGNDPELRNRFRDGIRRTLERYHPFFDTGACGVKMGAAFLDILDRERRKKTEKPGPEISF